MTTEELDELIAKYKYARDTYDMAKEASSQAHHQKKEVEAELLEALKECGKSKYHVDGIGTVFTRTKYTVTVPKDLENKRKLHEWIIGKYGKDVADNMMGINYQTLNSFVRRELEQAELNGDPTFQIPGVEAPQHTEEIAFRKGE